MDCTQVMESDVNISVPYAYKVQVAELRVNNESFPVYSGSNKIGRDPESCSIVLNNMTISKLHAVIQIEDRYLHLIRDMGSKNRTRLESMAMKPNIQYQLRNKQKLQFGDVVAEYSMFPQHGVIGESDDECPGNDCEAEMYEVEKSAIREVESPTIFQIETQGHESCFEIVEGSKQCESPIANEVSKERLNQNSSSNADNEMKTVERITSADNLNVVEGRVETNSSNCVKEDSGEETDPEEIFFAMTQKRDEGLHAEGLNTFRNKTCVEHSSKIVAQSESGKDVDAGLNAERKNGDLLNKNFEEENNINDIYNASTQVLVHSINKKISDNHSQQEVSHDYRNTNGREDSGSETNDEFSDTNDKENKKDEMLMEPQKHETRVKSQKNSLDKLLDTSSKSQEDTKVDSSDSDEELSLFNMTTQVYPSENETRNLELSKTTKKMNKPSECSSAEQDPCISDKTITIKNNATITELVDENNSIYDAKTQIFTSENEEINNIEPYIKQNNQNLPELKTAEENLAILKSGIETNKVSKEMNKQSLYNMEIARNQKIKNTDDKEIPYTSTSEKDEDNECIFEAVTQIIQLDQSPVISCKVVSSTPLESNLHIQGKVRTDSGRKPVQSSIEITSCFKVPKSSVKKKIEFVDISDDNDRNIDESSEKDITRDNSQSQNIDDSVYDAETQIFVKSIEDNEGEETVEPPDKTIPTLLDTSVDSISCVPTQIICNLVDKDTLNPSKAPRNEVPSLCHEDNIKQNVDSVNSNKIAPERVETHDETKSNSFSDNGDDIFFAPTQIISNIKTTNSTPSSKMEKQKETYTNSVLQEKDEVTHSLIASNESSSGIQDVEKVTLDKDPFIDSIYEAATQILPSMVLEKNITDDGKMNQSLSRSSSYSSIHEEPTQCIDELQASHSNAHVTAGQSENSSGKQSTEKKKQKNKQKSVVSAPSTSSVSNAIDLILPSSQELREAARECYGDDLDTERKSTPLDPSSPVLQKRTRKKPVKEIINNAVKQSASTLMTSDVNQPSGKRIRRGKSSRKNISLNSDQVGTENINKADREAHTKFANKEKNLPVEFTSIDMKRISEHEACESPQKLRKTIDSASHSLEDQGLDTKRTEKPKRSTRNNRKVESNAQDDIKTMENILPLTKSRRKTISSFVQEKNDSVSNEKQTRSRCSKFSTDTKNSEQDSKFQNTLTQGFITVSPQDKGQDKSRRQTRAQNISLQTNNGRNTDIYKTDRQTRMKSGRKEVNLFVEVTSKESKEVMREPDVICETLEKQSKTSDSSSLDRILETNRMDRPKRSTKNKCEVESCAEVGMNRTKMLNDDLSSTRTQGKSVSSSSKEKNEVGSLKRQVRSRVSQLPTNTRNSENEQNFQNMLAQEFITASLQNKRQEKSSRKTRAQNISLISDQIEIKNIDKTDRNSGANSVNKEIYFPVESTSKDMKRKSEDDVPEIPQKQRKANDSSSHSFQDKNLETNRTEKPKHSTRSNNEVESNAHDYVKNIKITGNVMPSVKSQKTRSSSLLERKDAISIKGQGLRPTCSRNTEHESKVQNTLTQGFITLTPQTSKNKKVSRREKIKTVQEDVNPIATPKRSGRTSQVAASDGSLCGSPVLQTFSQTKRKRGILASSTESDDQSSQSEGTPKRSSRLKIIQHVLFTGVVCSERDKATIKKLGGRIVQEPEESSILVTDKVRRTLKFLCIMGQGKPIVSPDWIKQSRISGQFLDPWKFIVKDKEAEKRYKFQLLTSLRLAASNKLLDGCSVFVTHSVKPPPNEMKSIVENCGGTFLMKEPRHTDWPQNSIIISSPDDQQLYNKFKKTSIPVVSAEIVLTGILQQKLNVNNYSLKL